jgi:transcriptional regulator with XRE-family HTH domain
MVSGKYLKLTGQRIKEVRLSKGVTQTDLGIDCDTTKAGISRIESGKNNLTIKTLLKIALALDVSIHDLLPEIKRE